MIIVALGLMMDKATPRRYFLGPASERSRERILSTAAKLTRGYSFQQRDSYFSYHRRLKKSVGMPQPPNGPSPPRAA